ncbi:2OG-Fe(II) oxygenase [Kitasatospora cathayae]|uniref:2OG-Fe(II) oxygenase n=1 Tax=Kitasatospora cathayae TaxID=3004092 RepID=A0ABY7Q2H3_9ACTN|nr:2OG-Fe(II) oxygenase [Kitasatospora sp. HUAS 3-15]WBP86905.1 2OG-Fe(II) oxygenase [Kitasatospora sp. HUAS 3-15]
MSAELRDRFFALSTGHAPADEVAHYRAQVDATDTEPTTTLDGLAISWHPTVRHKAVRFVDAERIDAGVRDLFARPSEEAPYLAAVFVDPRELSFRTFENIVPLDRLFTDTPLEFELVEPVELAAGAYSFSLRLPAAARARLERLDGLNLYVPPLNSGSRGGERFIFHSALLADALTAAVGRAAPPELREGFSHVNPVFRCNRFEPGDRNFHRHHDTPYYDAERKHVSRYTVLIYLTGGSAAPALDLAGGAALTEIEPFTCVVFDQRYEHEGAPYLDGRKVFLRSELVFTEPGFTHDPEIAALFSKACYWTGESVFAPELARHADTYYNQVATAHWNGLAAGAEREPFVHKQFRGVHFVANGYDFWFAKTDTLSLAECAAIALLDYFNCRIGDAAFRTLCGPEVIEADGTDWIPAFLRDRRAESAVAPIDKSLLFPAPEETEPSGCCPFHTMETFDSTRDPEILDLYTRAQNFAMAHIMPAPIVMLGEDVLLDPDRFLIEGNTIHVLGEKSLAPVNFAACWNAGGSPQNYIDVAATVGVAHFLVPPILFHEADGCYHLQFDFFRNSWMVRHRQASVHVPMVQRGMHDDDSPWPWVAAVDRSLASDRESAFWTAESAEVDEELAEIFAEYEEEFEGED